MVSYDQLLKKQAGNSTKGAIACNDFRLYQSYGANAIRSGGFSHQTHTAHSPKILWTSTLQHPASGKVKILLHFEPKV